MPEIPLDTWGEVLPSPEAGDIKKLKVSLSPGGGYLLITEERGSLFDTWFPTLDDVVFDLSELTIVWRPPEHGD